MITLEIPLWLLIVIAVLFCLITIHLIVGDLLAKIFYKIIQEKEKNRALEIIKEKKVNCYLFIGSENLEDYNGCVDDITEKRLTQEEYDLLNGALS